jgi:hypothetical protein
LLEPVTAITSISRKKQRFTGFEVAGSRTGKQLRRQVCGQAG